jgi:hypothetical protein
VDRAQASRIQRAVEDGHTDIHFNLLVREAQAHRQRPMMGLYRPIAFLRHAFPKLRHRLVVFICGVLLRSNYEREEHAGLSLGLS